MALAVDVFPAHAGVIPEGQLQMDIPEPTQVATRMGVDASTISQIERLVRRVYLDEVPELCEALGTTLEDLLAKAPADDRRKMGT